jgi:hypothetical protein
MLEKRERGCHCLRVGFRAEVDLDRLSQCSCTMCTKKGILHPPLVPEVFELLRGKHALTMCTFGTAVAQHAFCSHCGMHAFYVPRSQPDQISVNARCRRHRRTEPQAEGIERLSHAEGDPGPRSNKAEVRRPCRTSRASSRKGWGNSQLAQAFQPDLLSPPVSRRLLRRRVGRHQQRFA